MVVYLQKAAEELAPLYGTGELLEGALQPPSGGASPTVQTNATGDGAGSDKDKDKDEPWLETEKRLLAEWQSAQKK